MMLYILAPEYSGRMFQTEMCHARQKFRRTWYKSIQYEMIDICEDMMIRWKDPRKFRRTWYRMCMMYHFDRKFRRKWYQ